MLLGWDLHLRARYRDLDKTWGLTIRPNQVIKSEESTEGTLSGIQLHEIRQRAYELFEARGKEEGHALEDWLHAEGEITGAKA